MTTNSVETLVAEHRQRVDDAAARYHGTPTFAQTRGRLAWPPDQKQAALDRDRRVDPVFRDWPGVVAQRFGAEQDADWYARVAHRIQAQAPGHLALMTDSDWFFAHFEELERAYPGQWLAIYDHHVIANGRDPSAVLASARESRRRFFFACVAREAWERSLS